MRIVLEIVSGPAKGQDFQVLPRESCTLGRNEDANLVFAGDRTMSGLHLRLDCNPASCELIDLQSTNGTFVNGQRVQRQILTDGDVILAGQTTMRVRIELLAEEVVVSPSAGYDASPTAQKAQHAVSMPQAFELALADENCEVRMAALQAAVWTREAWLLDYCRTAVQVPNPQSLPALEVLAVLAKPNDLGIFSTVATTSEWGLDRLRILGIFGHPNIVPWILKAMQSSEAEHANAAACAFSKITGWETDVDLGLSADANEASSEESTKSMEGTEAVDVEAAKRHWEKLKNSCNGVTRLCRGCDVGRSIDQEVFDRLDMQSRREISMRSKYLGASGSLRELESFPLFAGK